MTRALFLFGLAALLLFKALHSPGEAQPQKEPVLTITAERGTVQIRGDVSSAGNESILAEAANQLFDAVDLQVRVTHQIPPGWSLVSEMLLRAIATTQTANAQMDAAGVTLRGVTADIAEFDASLERLKAVLLPGMALEPKVAMIRRSASLEQYCRRVFSAAVAGRTVDFGSSSMVPAAKSWPLLDALVELLVDCPASRLIVTGHTDSTGNPALNQQLSEARASAVVDYLAGRGISRERLGSTGVGATKPVAGNDSAWGRRQNRRIEFELRYD